MRHVRRTPVNVIYVVATELGIQHIAIYNRVYVEWEEFKLTMKEESSSQFSRLEIERERDYYL